MVNFYDPNDVIRAIDNELYYKQTHATVRNGNSISLRPIVYNCIREVYFEINDCERVEATSLDSYRSFYWTAPIGDALHQKFQKLMNLTEQQYTEQLMTFETFSPTLYVRSKCDGIDLRDPNNIILYEIKTKDKIPSKPYDSELLQCLLSVFFFRKELNLDIKGATMIYVNRTNPYNFVFFNYDLFDTTSPAYINAKDELKDTFEKIEELLECLRNKVPPLMTSKFIKTFDYGKPKCPNCPYRKVCGELK